MIYVSTDFVFNGEDNPEGRYTEDSATDAVNWYGQTKLEGEQAVVESGVRYCILRPAYPYRSEFDRKKDFVRAIKDRLASGGSIAGVTDHIMCPVFIDDFASAVDAVLKEDATGIFHVVGSQPVSPYDAAMLIAKTFGYDSDLISQTTRAQFFGSRAERPFNLTLNNDKIESLGVTMRTFEEGLSEIKRHLSNGDVTD